MRRWTSRLWDAYWDRRAWRARDRVATVIAYAIFFAAALPIAWDWPVGTRRKAACWPADRGIVVPYASPGRRLLAYIVDGTIATLVFVPLIGLVVDPDAAPYQLLAATGTLLVLFVGYLILFDAGQRGATPGKRLMRIRVVDEGGAPQIGYRRAAVRRAVWFLGGVCLCRLGVGLL